jgi:hypothetical protein
MTESVIDIGAMTILTARQLLEGTDPTFLRTLAEEERDLLLSSPLLSPETLLEQCLTLKGEVERRMIKASLEEFQYYDYMG